MCHLYLLSSQLLESNSLMYTLGQFLQYLQVQLFQYTSDCKIQTIKILILFMMLSQSEVNMGKSS